ncbi:MAG: hypothetical protein GC178_02910 [Flavobacteriales bacterium]|nr:hypothetical protein [Flavobacteriales bacterium]
MKKPIVSLILFLSSATAFACEVCKRNQPRVLQEFTHGAGPDGTVDYLIMGSAILIVAVALGLAIKFLVKPNENNPEHIKNIVTNEGF